MDLKKYIAESELAANQPVTGDEFDFTINETYNIESEVLEHAQDEITIAVDERAMAILEHIGAFDELTEAEAEYDRSSGSPYDRGGADAYYGRRFNPHKMVPNPKDPHGRIQQPVTDPDEIAAYTAGWNAEDGRKDYGESVDDIVESIINENMLGDFLPPFSANGLYVTDRRGDSVLEVTRHGSVAKEVANALNKYTDASESAVNEDIVQHKTHGAVYGKDGKAKLFMTRGEATAVADAMAKKHGSSGVSVVQGPYTGYMVKMPESQVDEVIDTPMKKIGYIAKAAMSARKAGKVGDTDTLMKRKRGLDLVNKKHLPTTNEEEQTDEAGMPSGVIRSKQRMAEYTPEQMLAKYKEVASRFGEATPAAMEKLAREEAWRHGYGRMSDHYWKQFKHLVGESVNEVDEFDAYSTVLVAYDPETLNVVKTYPQIQQMSAQRDADANGLVLAHGKDYVDVLNKSNVLRGLPKESVTEVGDTKQGQKKLDKVFNRANKQSSDAWKKMDFEKGEKRGKVADLAYDRINDREMAYDRLKEAEYQGRTVQLGKPMKGDVRKFKVYVKDPKTGNVKKVNFGDPNMEIKRDDPKRRKNFRARHGCGTSRASDRTKAAYWSCRMWSSKPVSKIV